MKRNTKTPAHEKYRGDRPKVKEEQKKKNILNGKRDSLPIVSA